MGSVVDGHRYSLAVAHIVAMQVDVDVLQIRPFKSRDQGICKETNVETGFGGKVIENQLLKPLCVVTNGVDIGNQSSVCLMTTVDTPCISKVRFMSKQISILDSVPAEYEGGYLESATKLAPNWVVGSSRQLRCKEIYVEKRKYQSTACSTL